MTQQLINHQSRLLRAGGTAGMLGPALFAVVFILQNVVRTDDDAIAEPVSALSIGEYGWVQRLNFVVFGVLLLVFAAALHRGVASSRLGWVGPTLLLVAGVGLFVAATFSLARDETGAIYDPNFHQVGGTLFFGGTALALIALSRRLARDPRWRNLSRYSLGAGIASIVGGVVINTWAIPDGAPLHGEVGLIQRIIVLAVIFPALITLGHRLRRLTA
ncbi:MAG: DUF998 domain-containing protein [Actinomycetota bacterium]|nr:DUF998 domain-containing protein [Actinomycetota bacterium]